MEIKVLGPGCANCTKLEKLVQEVVQELGITANVEKITDVKEIAKSGVLMTPGLIVNGEIKSTGRVPSKSQVMSIITTAMASN